MNIASFVRLVGLHTKVLSVLPFLFGSLYAACTFKNFNLLNAVIMYLSLLLFDMSISAINHYINYKKASLQESFDDEIHNALVHHDFDIKFVKSIILMMLTIATLLGTYLVYQTDIVVLLLGILYIVNSILYISGPIPISYTPFSEAFFGISKGLSITLISIYIHIFTNGFLTLQFISNQLILHCDFKVLIGILIVCMPFVLTITNMVLAHNLCNMQKDLIIKRYTLPVYMGKQAALKLWELNYYAVYLFILIAVLTNYLPLICLLSLITFWPVKHNMDYFLLKQDHPEAFRSAIHNFLLIGISLIVALGLDLSVIYFLFK